MHKGSEQVHDELAHLRSNKGLSFYANTIVRFTLLVTVILQSISVGLLGVFVKSKQSTVIVHYNVYFGIDLIGSWEQIFIIPGIVFLFSLANTFFARWFYMNNERIAAYILLITSILISLGSILACASIAYINY